MENSIEQKLGNTVIMSSLIQVVVKCGEIVERNVMKYLLYKFFETQEYRQNFIDGLLYANKFSYFRAKENKTVGVADEFENSKLIAWPDETHFVQNAIVEEDGRVFVKSVPYDKKPVDYKENQGFITYRIMFFVCQLYFLIMMEQYRFLIKKIEKILGNMEFLFEIQSHFYKEYVAQ